MGVLCSRPEYIYSIAHLEMNHTFCVKRSSGEWESGHVLVSGTTLGRAVDYGHDEKYPREALRGLPLAANVMFNSKTNRPEGYSWHLLLSKIEPESPITAWRLVDDIRPDDMSEEDAVVWRMNLRQELNKLEKERYP